MRLTQMVARVFEVSHGELEEACGWRKKTMKQENGVEKWQVSHGRYLSYSAPRFVQLIGRLPRRRRVRERAPKFCHVSNRNCQRFVSLARENQT